MDEHLARHLHINHRHAVARNLAHNHGGNSLDSDSPTPVDVGPASLSKRQNPTNTCTDTTSPGCVLPTEAHDNTAAIIGVSVAIPLVLAIVVLYILHRRATKRQAAEDAKDAVADLDFGIDPKYKEMNNAGKGKKIGRKPVKGRPDPTADINFEKEFRKGHAAGMSLDLGNPYILPPEVNGSRDSLHSLTRSLQDSSDPYRMVAPRTPTHPGYNDAGSVRSGSDRNLLANAAPNPSSRSQSPFVPQSNENSIQRKGVAATATETVAMPTFDFTNHGESEERLGHLSHNSHLSHQSHTSHKSVDVVAANRISNQDKSLPATPQGDALTTPPPRGASLGDKSPYAANNNAGPVDPYGFQENVVPPSPEAEPRQLGADAANFRGDEAENFPYPPPPEPTNENRMTLGLGLDLAGNRMSVLRPLPPDDPNDTAESRANRIRSFYKEYFAEDTAHTYEAGILDYYEDYGDEYLQDGAVFDPETGQFIVAQAPYADPITRRAMTPPPRGPPAKFRGGPGGPRRPGHMSQGSSPGLGHRGRAFSNASYSRNGPGFGPRGRGPGKRPLPPPSALHNLPTPHLLKDDSLLLATDFAPPKSYRDRAAGRSDSPLLEDRPFSPQVPIAGSPLASAFTELAVVPSPHMLRKSGTFTGLDFAPPPRFRDMDGGGSDAGSIRSGKSGFTAVSNRQNHAIRAGAYRLSRVPKELVGTKNDLMDTLKPQWKIGA